MKEENKDKRLLQVELDKNVKKVSITGVDADDKVVMRKELSGDELDSVVGGMISPRPIGLSWTDVSGGTSFIDPTTNEICSIGGPSTTLEYGERG
jgi:hypothetical protein